MNAIQGEEIKKSFELYLRNVSPVIHEIGFWNHWLKHTIEVDLKRDPNPRTIFSFLKASTYESQSGILKIAPESISFYNYTWQEHRKNFFRWIMNLSILKTYNALELFLLQAIQISEFPQLANPIDGPKEMKKIENKICEFLKLSSISPEKKNNRYIIQFLRIKFPYFVPFMSEEINVSLK